MPNFSSRNISKNNLMISGVTLVMPVFRGGKLFEESLLALANQSVKFSRVCISINGSSADRDVVEKITSSYNFCQTLHVFETVVELRSFEHLAFITEKLSELLTADDMLLLLAHDDRLVFKDEFCFDSTSFFGTLNARTTYFPEYVSCKADSGFSDGTIVRQNISYSSREFFRKSLAAGYYTNMSGMIVSLRALTDVAGSLGRMKTGARFEYLLATAPSVSRVMSLASVQAYIMHRDNSDGALIGNREHDRAGVFYILLYLFRVGSLCDWLSGVVLIRLLKFSIFGYLPGAAGACSYVKHMVTGLFSRPGAKLNNNEKSQK